MAFYHVTKQENLESILQEGLTPLIGERSALLNEPKPAVYVFTDSVALEDAMMNWLGDYYENYDGTLVYIEIETDQAFEQSLDWEAEFHQVITPDKFKAIFDEEWQPIPIMTSKLKP